MNYGFIVELTYVPKPDWKRHANACATTRNTKNRCVLCGMPKILLDVFPHFLVIPSVSFLLKSYTHFPIAPIKFSDRLYSAFHMFFYFHIITFSFSGNNFLAFTMTFLFNTQIVMCKSQDKRYIYHK